ncbi:MAG: hypothetical protein KatS3mg103_0348 [Phycisphaerales bacterium]|nr:MAG: hypothetical protein KatS3mg103_0348 [Phycisphaerales bacterium]
MAAYTLRRFGKVALQDALGLDRRRRKEALAALPRGTALGAWRRIAQRIAHHGDPTPRVDPLLAARPIAP